MVSAVSDHEHPVDPERVAAARSSTMSAADAQAVGALLTLLADPLRARILGALLAVDELCVGDLALALEASEDAVSYALRILRTAGLVRRRRDGRMRYYRLIDGAAREALSGALAEADRLAELHPELVSEGDR